MSRNQSEYNLTEKPAVELFQKMGYDYYDASKHDDERNSIHDVVLENRLKSALKRINPWMDENNLNIAFRKITSAGGTSFIDTNRKIHHLLKGPNISVPHTVNGRRIDKSVHYIDYSNLQNNDFLIVNQMRFKGLQSDSIPDITVFLNGLPIAVIECKSPNILNADSEAVNDLDFYQRNTPKLFHYNQVCAAIYKVGGKYGPIQAEEIHYNPYQCRDNEKLPISQLLDGSRDLIPQDILLYHLFKKENLLDIIRNFIIFETVEGKIIKKLPRYPQIRAVNAAIEKLKTREKGGVVWHTQGSGKSLTMVYLATKLRRDEHGFNNPTIIVMTDRKELDKQITDTFRNCDFPNPIRARSIRGLGQLLKDTYGKTIMTTIQKFQETDENGNLVRPVRGSGRNKNNKTTEIKRIVEEGGRLVKITSHKTPDGETMDETRDIIDVPRISDKENLFVFVDEAHRSHYGFLAAFMRKALPNAKFIAFTGTPIDKKNKSTLAEFYGGKYLDTYTIKESVADGATLPIYYDARLSNHHVNKELIDQKFETEFKDYSPEKKERLRQKAAELNTFFNAENRIQQIAEDIIHHYSEKIYPDGFKAMLVCHSRETAINYQNAFEKLRINGVHNFQTRVIMSLDIKKDPERFKQLATQPHEIKQAVDDFKLPFGNEEDKAKDGKKQFDNTAIVIVCDMLLTGYDVPIAQVMYLDKLLIEHNLLQAIARVNRTRAGKNAGFIIDYCGITRRLSEALAMFSDDLKPDEVMEKTKDELPRLQNYLNKLIAFFKPINLDPETQRTAYIDKAVQYLEPENKRDEFKLLLKAFTISLNILLPATEAIKYKKDLTLYNEIKYQAANTYVDDSLRITKNESRKIQKLVDEHLTASGIRYLLDEPVSIIDREKFDEEIRKTLSIESARLKRLNRIRHIIKTNFHKDPEFYKPLSERLEQLIKNYQEERFRQLELFKENELDNELNQIEDKIINKHNEARKLGFKTEGESALYNTLEKIFPNDAVSITKTLYQSLTDELGIVGWHEREQVQRTMRLKIKNTMGETFSQAEKDHLAHQIVNILIQNRENKS
jgi:type I restriction enzyme R subunit